MKARFQTPQIPMMSMVTTTFMPMWPPLCQSQTGRRWVLVWSPQLPLISNAPNSTSCNRFFTLPTNTLHNLPTTTTTIYPIGTTLHNLPTTITTDYPIGSSTHNHRHCHSPWPPYHTFNTEQTSFLSNSLHVWRPCMVSCLGTACRQVGS